MKSFESLALCAAFALGCMPATAASDGNIHLSISAEEGGSVRGQCTVRQSGGEEVHLLGGELPLEGRWTGESVTCEITQLSPGGAVEVELEKDGNRSRSRTGGQGSKITLSVA